MRTQKIERDAARYRLLRNRRGSLLMVDLLFAETVGEFDKLLDQALAERVPTHRTKARRL